MSHRAFINQYQEMGKCPKCQHNYLNNISQEEKGDKLIVGLKCLKCEYIYKKNIWHKKTYYIMYNVGKIKYLVNFNNGAECHKDGSKFYDIETFSNKKKMNKFIKLLKQDGYLLV